jgi:hypothetical protein
MRRGHRLLAKSKFPLSELLARDECDIDLRVDTSAETTEPEPGPRPS